MAVVITPGNFIQLVESFKVVFRGFKDSSFSSGYSSFANAVHGLKLDRMLHHRADPTNAMSGDD